jgi:TPP-dependent 2-oxoacid decarboxylase
MQIDDPTLSSTIADYLLTRLVEAGVRHVFGVPGDYNLRLLDVIEADPDLEWVGSANELNAAYAADGYARMHGLAAVVTTYGVGELSAINGIAGSFAESVPVLMIAGTPTTHVQDSGMPVHHSLLDGDSGHFARAFRGVTCASALLSADNATAEIDRVLERMLADMRPGYLMLPSDLVGVPAPAATSRLAERASPIGPLERALSDGSATAVADTERRFTERASTMLAGASNVVVLADQLADRHRVHRQLDMLIRSGNLMSATIAGGKSTIDETTPGFLGLYIGALSEPSVRDAVETADVVIGAGLRLFDLSSGGFTTKLDPDRLIDLQPDHAVAGNMSFDGVSMAVALDALTDIVADRPALPAAVVVPDALDHDADVQVRDAPLTQAAFWRQIGGFLRPTDVIAADQGTPFYGLLGLRLPSDVDVISQPLWSSIGYALPAMMGAQLGAAPDRRGVLFIGDGSFQMTAQELGTIIRRGMAPVVFLLNNDGYTVERAINGWTAAYNEIPRWDWSLVPGALGAGPDTIVARAGTPAELSAALAACDQNPGTLAFIEVVLDRHDMPPLLTELATAVATRNDREPETTTPRHAPARLSPQRRPQSCTGPGPSRRRAR